MAGPLQPRHWTHSILRRPKGRPRRLRCRFAWKSAARQRAVPTAHRAGHRDEETRHSAVVLPGRTPRREVQGYVQFQGFGIIERAEFVSQLDQKTQRAFSNVRYDFVVMSAVSEGEELDWDWINARRDPTLSLDECLRRAPAAWQWWVKHGPPSLPRVRRLLSRLRTVAPDEQRPKLGSREHKVLQSIADHYADRKHRFELLAEQVVQDLVMDSGMSYVRGWITPRSADGGADFIGRLDVGPGLGGTKLVLLGQAKCERTNAPTGGNHIARTVARLRRGWIGAYVTTSFFSRAVQAEVIDDEYPIMLMGGSQVASSVEKSDVRARPSRRRCFLG